jgi:hypothetical protein
MCSARSAEGALARLPSVPANRTGTEPRETKLLSCSRALPPLIYTTYRWLEKWRNFFGWQKRTCALFATLRRQPVQRPGRLAVAEGFLRVKIF